MTRLSVVVMSKQSEKRVRINHGDSGTRFYKTWENMLQRCSNPNSSNYMNYGGRGIQVDERWKEYINFKADMFDAYQESAKQHGEKNITIDRINNEGNYETNNCRWSTKAEQALNRRRRSDNTSGYTGVNHDKRRNKWVTNISIDGKQKQIGSYADIDKAVRIRRAYEAYYYNTIQLNDNILDLQRIGERTS